MSDFKRVNPQDTSDIPQGVLLETMMEGGEIRELIFENGLLWIPDRSMYVYFTPKFWRVKA